MKGGTPSRAPFKASGRSAARKSCECSGPTVALNNVAASATLAAIGPAVSCVLLIGTMPCCEIHPTVGLNPTMPLTDAGHTIDPLVSVPTASGAKCSTTDTADPELDPQALRRLSRGFPTSPPPALQPLVDCRER